GGAAGEWGRGAGRQTTPGSRGPRRPGSSSVPVPRRPRGLRGAPPTGRASPRRSSRRPSPSESGHPRRNARGHSPLPSRRGGRRALPRGSSLEQRASGNRRTRRDRRRRRRSVDRDAVRALPLLGGHDAAGNEIVDRTVDVEIRRLRGKERDRGALGSRAPHGFQERGVARIEPEAGRARRRNRCRPANPRGGLAERGGRRPRPGEDQQEHAREGRARPRRYEPRPRPPPAPPLAGTPPPPARPSPSTPRRTGP